MFLYTFCMNSFTCVLYVFIGHCKTVSFIQFVISVFVWYTYVCYVFIYFVLYVYNCMHERTIKYLVSCILLQQHFVAFFMLLLWKGAREAFQHDF